MSYLKTKNYHTLPLSLQMMMILNYTIPRSPLSLKIVVEPLSVLYLENDGVRENTEEFVVEITSSLDYDKGPLSEAQVEIYNI